jgi:hypothetical protein
MDDYTMVNQIISSIIQRHMKTIQAYEIEITNMMAEIIKLKSSLSEEKD